MKEYKEWLEQAKKDLAGAEYNIKGNYPEIGAFLLQQSAEKALKAVLIKEQKKLVKTHDLVNISKLIEVPEEIKNCCNELNPAYMFSRYPDVEGKMNLKDEIKNLIKCAESILEWAEKRL